MSIILFHVRFQFRLVLNKRMPFAIAFQLCFGTRWFLKQGAIEIEWNVSASGRWWWWWYLLVENVNSMQRNTEALVQHSEQAGLEVNTSTLSIRRHLTTRELTRIAVIQWLLADTSKCGKVQTCPFRNDVSKSNLTSWRNWEQITFWESLVLFNSVSFTNYSRNYSSNDWTIQIYKFPFCSAWVPKVISHIEGENIDWGCLRTWLWEEYLDLRGRM
jgi:hypothetical protein